MERLAEKMKCSRAQEATITKKVAEWTTERDQTADRELEREAATNRTRPYQQEIDDFLDPRRRHPRDRSCDDDFISTPDCNQAQQDRVQNDARERFAEHEHERESAGPPIDIQDADPADIQLDVRDLGNIQLAYSTQLYDLHAQTGEPTYVLFGGWQTEQQLGFVATVHAHGETDVRMYTEDREGRDIEPELHDRIGQIIERSHSHEASHNCQPDRDHQREPAQLEAGQPPAIDPREQAPQLQLEHEPVERDPQLQPEPERIERDPYIEQAIQEERDRQQAFEQGIDQDRDQDLGFGIET
jgi:hypothetical protein